MGSESPKKHTDPKRKIKIF